MSTRGHYFRIETRSVVGTSHSSVSQMIVVVEMPVFGRHYVRGKYLGLFGLALTIAATVILARVYSQEGEEEPLLDIMDITIQPNSTTAASFPIETTTKTVNYNRDFEYTTAPISDRFNPFQSVDVDVNLTPLGQSLRCFLINF